MRYTQPQGGPARIDWANPLARGLAAVFLPLPGGGMLEVLSGVRGTPVGGPSKLVNRNGIATTGARVINYSFASTAALNVTGALTIVVVGRATASGMFYLAKGPITASAVPYCFTASSSVNLYRGGATEYEQWGSGAPALSTALSVVGVSNNGVLGTGSPARYYMNGTVYPATGGTMADTVATANSTAVTVGAMDETNLVLLYARALRDDEHAQLATNPWQVFKGNAMPLAATAPALPALAATLGAATLAAGGTLPVAAAASPTVGPLSAAAAATVAVAAGLGGTLGTLVSQAGGGVTVSASAAPPLNQLTAAGAAQVLVQADASLAGQALQLAATARGRDLALSSKRTLRLAGENRTLRAPRQCHTLRIARRRPLAR